MLLVQFFSSRCIFFCAGEAQLLNRSLEVSCDGSGTYPLPQVGFDSRTGRGALQIPLYHLFEFSIAFVSYSPFAETSCSSVAHFNSSSTILSAHHSFLEKLFMAISSTRSTDSFLACSFVHVLLSCRSPLETRTWNLNKGLPQHRGTPPFGCSTRTTSGLSPMRRWAPVLACTVYSNDRVVVEAVAPIGTRLRNGAQTIFFFTFKSCWNLVTVFYFRRSARHLRTPRFFSCPSNRPSPS